MRSVLSTPIRIRGTAVGVLIAECRRTSAFNPGHARISWVIAGQVAIALQGTQTLDSDLLFADLDRMIFSSADTQQVIQTALEKVLAELQRLEHVEHSGAQIMFLRGENQLEIVHSTNPADVGMMLPLNKSVSGRAIRQRRTIIIDDVSKEPHYHRMLGDSIQSEISVPILFGEDDVAIGILNVESADLHAFHRFYQIVLESFAEKVKTLLAFAKLRADVTEALEMRTADEFLVAVGDQTSHMIHRINSTVGAMRLRIIELQDLRKGAPPDDNEFLDEALAALRSLAERALKMPDQMLHILSQERSRVDVNECVRRALSQVEVSSKVRLRVTCGNGIPAMPLFCFDIIVQNLVQNAIDAMPAGGDLEIVTSAVIHPTLSTGYLQLTVSDTGQGIADDMRSRVFDLNFTTKKVRGRGLGFGLWWVRNFVLRSRGDITIDSQPGHGTTVTVKIPIGMPGDNKVAGLGSTQEDEMSQ
jgi:signal transduction histidine kinase